MYTLACAPGAIGVPGLSSSTCLIRLELYASALSLVAYGSALWSPYDGHPVSVTSTGTAVALRFLTATRTASSIASNTLV
uniref:Uncharacterized protein n=1 Tax=Arundo donax TaxID=35708 RepID=A0A0A9EYI4_ARUDO